jgi:hypothetical protein
MKNKEIKEKEESEFKEYKFLLDVLDDYEDEKFKLDKDIEDYKTNPQYRALMPKDWLPINEKKQHKLEVVIRALSDLREHDSGRAEM